MLFRVSHWVEGASWRWAMAGLSWRGPPKSSSLGSGRGMSTWSKSLFGTVWGRAQGLAPLGQEEEGGRRTRMCWARGLGRGAGASANTGGRGQEAGKHTVFLPVASHLLFCKCCSDPVSLQQARV